MTKTRTRLFWVMAVFFAPFTVQAQTIPQFSAKECADYAAKNNVQVKNALIEVKLQEQINKEVTAAAYPHLNASLSTTYNPNVATQVIPNFIAPSTYRVLIDENVKNGNGMPIQMPEDFGFISAQFGTKYSANAGISLSQLLFDGQVFVGLQARKTTLDFQNKNAEITEINIRTNIYKIYYQLVVSKKQTALLDSNISLVNNLLHDTKVMYENGVAEKLDIDKTTVRLANLQTEKAKLQNAISNGYYGLKVLMGFPIKQNLVLTDTLNDDIIKTSLLQNADFIYADRKEYQYAKLGQALGKYNVKRYQLSQLPSVSLNGQYAKNAQRDKWNFFGKGDWFSISNISLGINIPIFNGFITKAKIAEAKLDLEKINNQIATLEQSIDSEVEVAKNNFITAISTMDYQRKNMELAEKVYQQTKKKYEIGTGSQTDINAAQSDLKLAQGNYISALYDATIAKIDFQTATGKLQ